MRKIKKGDVWFCGDDLYIRSSKNNVERWFLSGWHDGIDINIKEFEECKICEPVLFNIMDIKPTHNTKRNSKIETKRKLNLIINGVMF